jgi:hypothetical protein
MSTMPRLTRVFDQDDIRIMTTALDGAWNYLHSRNSELARAERAETTRRMLAKRIIAATRSERRKYSELLMSALYGIMRNTDFETNTSFHPMRARATRARTGL